MKLVCDTGVYLEKKGGMKMKKLSILFSVLIISIVLINTGYSSSLIMYSGEYSNGQVTFKISNRHAAWLSYANGQRRGGSSRTIVFKIEANPGYKIFNETIVKYNGIIYKLNAKNPENNLYREGEISFKGSFLDPNASPVIELECYVRKNGNETNEKVVKKLKISVPRRPRGSHDIVELTVEEI